MQEALILATRIAQVVRIIPAYAGSTRIPPLDFSGIGDHLRMRGEHCMGYSVVT